MKLSLSLLIKGISIFVAVLTLCGWTWKAGGEAVRLTEDRPSLQGDVLVFSNETSLQNTIQQMMTNQGNLGNFEAQYPGFTSIRMAYESLPESVLEGIASTGNMTGYENILALVPDENSPSNLNLEMNVQSDLLSHLVNDKGLLVVGAEAYKFTFHKAFKTPSTNLEVLRNKTPSELQNTPGVEVESVVKKASSRNCTTLYNNGKKKIIGYIRTVKNIFHEEISTGVRHYKSPNGTNWHRTAAQRLEVVGQGYYSRGGNNPCNGCYFSVNNGQNGTWHFKHIIDSSSTPLQNENYEFVNSTTKHRVLLDNGLREQCIIVYP